MPSTRPVVAFRPDEREERLLNQLQEETGLAKSQILGLVLRAYVKEWEENKEREIAERRRRDQDRKPPF
jgi:predicted DNA-binding protein